MFVCRLIPTLHMRINWCQTALACKTLAHTMICMLTTSRATSLISCTFENAAQQTPALLIVTLAACLVAPVQIAFLGGVLLVIHSGAACQCNVLGSLRITYMQKDATQHPPAMLTMTPFGGFCCACADRSSFQCPTFFCCCLPGSL